MNNNLAKAGLNGYFHILQLKLESIDIAGVSLYRRNILIKPESLYIAGIY